MATAGATVSLSPVTEFKIGYGLPRTSELLAACITTGLSVDTTVLAGDADMFAIMKMTEAIQNVKAENEFKLPSRRVLELATIEGARSMGIDGLTGSLTRASAPTSSWCRCRLRISSCSPTRPRCWLRRLSPRTSTRWSWMAASSNELAR